MEVGIELIVLIPIVLQHDGKMYRVTIFVLALGKRLIDAVCRL